MKKIFFTFLITLALFSPKFGQSKTSPDEHIIWKSRLDTITFNIVKDAEKSAPTRRSLVYTQLADLWWKFDKSQANSWFEKSVDLIIYKTDKQSKSKNYFQTVNQVLKIISNRNQKQTDRLIKLLSETDEVSENDKNSNADALIEFAILIVKENPNKALEIGLSSFKIGQPSNFYKLYWELKSVSPSLADKFFQNIVSTTLTSPNPKMISGLKTMIFPEIIFPNAPDEIQSANSVKTQTLNLFADYIIQQQTKFSNEMISSCEADAFLIAPLESQFSLLLPQRSSLVIQSVNICLSNKSQPVSNLASANLQNKNDVDELLKLADEAKDDLNVRSYYLFRAANLANNQEKYKLAAEILNGMSKEEKESDPAFWDELRYTVASGLAYQQFQEKDIQGVNHSLNEISVENRAFAKIGFALKFSPNNIATREVVLEKIREARSDLIKSKKTFSEKSPFWFQVIKIYSDYSMMADSTEVFREIVVAFNQSISEDDSKSTMEITSESIISSVSSTLIELQDNSLFEIAGLVKDEKSRIQINLGFLRISLDKYERVIKQVSN